MCCVWRPSHFLSRSTNMSIISYPSAFFNILDQHAYDVSVHSFDITAHICNCCPFRCNCSCPKAIYHGHYRHPVYRIINRKLVIRNILVQRVLCKGCGKTHSLVPSFHIPFFRFIKEDLMDILFNPDSLFFDFDVPHLIRAISSVLSRYNNTAPSYSSP